MDEPRIEPEVEQLHDDVLVLRVLDGDVVEACRSEAGRVAWGDGRETAGLWNQSRKSNSQSTALSRTALMKQVVEAIAKNSTVQDVLFPAEIIEPRLAKYEEGDHYQVHTDAAIQSGVRADVSFTISLSDPDEYVGGALRLGDGGCAREFTPPRGYAVFYPTGTIHQVRPVLKGTRLVMVGWMRSRIRRVDDRRVIARLSWAMRRLFEAGMAGREFVELTEVHNELVRRWVE